MTTAIRYLGLISALALAGCVTVPAGPTVMVLPGTSKSFEAFQADNFACQQFAQSSLGLNAPPGQLVADPAGGGAAVAGTLIGAAAGAAIGAVTGQAGAGAAIGAGSGLLFGSAAGANASSWNNVTVQRRYDNAFLQCMYAKGNQIPVRAASRNG
jgi:Glycine-zipper domain